MAGRVHTLSCMVEHVPARLARHSSSKAPYLTRLSLSRETPWPRNTSTLTSETSNPVGLAAALFDLDK